MISMKAGPALVDTNILIYAFDAREPEKRETAAGLLARCWRGEERLSVSVQNLAEFSVVVTEKIHNPIPRPVLRKFIAAVAAYDGWTVVGYDAGTILAANDLKERCSLHFWDALLAATMKENGISTIYTEDRHFEKVPGLAVINPLEQLPRES
jgi:predicted nucleic acid-binding protein